MKTLFGNVSIARYWTRTQKWNRILTSTVTGLIQSEFISIWSDSFAKFRLIYQSWLRQFLLKADLLPS